MGVFDPAQTEMDNETTTGIILSAMVQFPGKFSFSVVGKTGGDEQQVQEYIDDVRRIIINGSGGNILECRVTPRGKNFTKITAHVIVDSVSIINGIYKDLGSLERTVMNF